MMSREFSLPPLTCCDALEPTFYAYNYQKVNITKRLIALIIIGNHRTTKIIYPKKAANSKRQIKIIIFISVFILTSFKNPFLFIMHSNIE